jgi:DNA-binding Lrp family transcriptional regulator
MAVDLPVTTGADGPRCVRALSRPYQGLILASLDTSWSCKMVDRSDDISNTVFRRTLTSLQGRVAMSGRMLDLLILIDGRATVKEVSQKMNMSLTQLRPLISKLKASGVITETLADLDSKFFGYLVARLSRIAGPIARMMVEEAVLEVGEGTFRVPKNRGLELVERLGDQIPNPKQKAAFIQESLKKLSEF